MAPFLLRMVWNDLAFLHWRVDAGRLRGAVPAGLDLETFDGSAWLGVVPFRMTGVGPRGLPALPGVSAFPELNVRTYVANGGRHGVWFFSLDAGDRLAVRAARRSFFLPYHDARMTCERRGDAVAYRSVRTERGQPRATFVGRYEPTGPVFRAPEGSLEAFLTDRLCLFAADPGGRLFRGDVEHPPWPLQAARVEVEENSMAVPLGIALDRAPDHALFARRVDVTAATLVRVPASDTLGG